MRRTLKVEPKSDFHPSFFRRQSLEIKVQRHRRQCRHDETGAPVRTDPACSHCDKEFRCLSPICMCLRLPDLFENLQLSCHCYPSQLLYQRMTSPGIMSTTTSVVFVALLDPGYQQNKHESHNVTVRTVMTAVSESVRSQGSARRHRNDSRLQASLDVSCTTCGSAA